MHKFTELIDRSTNFALNALHEAERRNSDQLQGSGATSLVKTAQMIRLHRIIVAVGMFSIFEAILQDRLLGDGGFGYVRRCLRDAGEVDLEIKFSRYVNAINVLKHGSGRSYQRLLEEIENLPFRIKPLGEAFFYEGDVSEVSSLIDVDDRFILECADIIRNVSAAIAKVRPDAYL